MFYTLIYACPIVKCTCVQWSSVTYFDCTLTQICKNWKLQNFGDDNMWFPCKDPFTNTNCAIVPGANHIITFSIPRERPFMKIKST